MRGFMRRSRREGIGCAWRRSRGGVGRRGAGSRSRQLGNEFEHRSAAVADGAKESVIAAVVHGAIEVSGRVHGGGRVGIPSVSLGELVEHREHPRGVDLKECSILEFAPSGRDAVEVARSILDQTCIGISPVQETPKTIQYRFFTFWAYFEHRS